MKKISILLLILALTAACSTDGVDARPDSFEVSIDGKKFSARGNFAYWTDFSNDSFNAYGFDEDLTIYVGFEPGETVGSAPISDNRYVYLIYEDGRSYSTLVSGSSGTIELVEKTATVLKGNFDVILTNFDDANDQITLSGGSFNVVYQ